MFKAETAAICCGVLFEVYCRHTVSVVYRKFNYKIAQVTQLPCIAHVIVKGNLMHYVRKWHKEACVLFVPKY